MDFSAKIMIAFYNTYVLFNTVAYVISSSFSRNFWYFMIYIAATDFTKKGVIQSSFVTVNSFRGKVLMFFCVVNDFTKKCKNSIFEDLKLLVVTVSLTKN